MKINKNKNCIFLYDTGIFKNEIIVSVNVSYDEVLRFFKKENIIKSIVEEFKSDKDEIVKYMTTKLGFCIIFSFGGIFLWLKNYKNNWNYLEVLLHEIHHIVYYMSKQKGFEDEKESQAWLFCKIFMDLKTQIYNNLIKEKK